MKHLISAAALVALLAVPALGTWSEDFQSYALGSPIDGQGGWAGWDGSPVQAIVSNAHPKFAGDLAVQLAANDDLVHQYSGYTSGQWVYSAWQYIPQIHTGDATFFILMNKYTPASKGWSVQMKFDYATGLVTDDESATKPGVPIVYDEWKEIRVLIDLDANTQTTFYNGSQVGTAEWYEPANADHLKSIAAVDIWADNGGAGVHYDNISLVPEPTTLCLLALGGLLWRRR